MAGFQPAAPGTVEVVLRFRLFGIPIVIVINVRMTSGFAPNPTELSLINTQMTLWCGLDLMPVLSSDLEFVGTQSTDISVSTGGQVTVTNSVFGGVSSESLPSQLAVVVSLRTALRGRSYRGRSFIPGIPISYQASTGGIVTTTAQSTILTAYNGIDGRLTTAHAQQVVLSRRQLGHPVLLAIPTTVISRLVDDTFDTIRRRGANAHRSG
jgi:hypothetical protein